ncbi:hypothetical protein ACLUUI_14450 [Enterobacterales bacterium AW_CKDN230030176-1A_HGKHYDSX7]
MADSKKRAPINGVHSEMVATMVDHQITGLFDRVRMHEFWRRLLAGDNDPEVIAEGLCRALSGGRYIEGPARTVTINLNIQSTANPEALAAALTTQVEQAVATHG